MSMTLSKRLIKGFGLDMFRWLSLLCDLLLFIISSRKSNQHNHSLRLICTFICAPVHSGFVHTILPSNLPVCFILSVLSEQHGIKACGTEPSVSHQGGTARHATTIKAMDFHCSLSQDLHFILACPAHFHFIAVSKRDMSFHSLKLWQAPKVPHTVTLPKFLNVPKVLFVCPPFGVCFVCFMILLVNLSPSHSPSPRALTQNYLTAESKQPEALFTRHLLCFCFSQLFSQIVNVC